MSEVIADRYELVRELGVGGMARVVAARDRLLDREVAVKLLTASTDAGARARFLGEARAAARLRHPNVVAVHDTGEHDGQPYLVMELIEGETVGQLLERQGRLDLEVAVAVTLGVLDALDHAHAAGLVHRDVKPDNVLLPDDGGVKLADFGIAKAMDEATAGLTATGAVMGTASYLAPELVDGAKPAPASDVYSVGCLLYALLAGRPPFTGESALAIAYAQRHTPVPPIVTLRPDIPPDLAVVVGRALEKDPADRYPDAASMRSALRDGPDRVPAPVPATPPLPGPSAGPAATAVLPADGPVVRGGRRRSTLQAVLGVIVVAAILGLGAWWLAGARGGDGELATDDGGPEQTEADPADLDGADADAGGPTEGDGGAEDADEVEEVDDGAAEPATVEDLIGLLSSAPTGTYGEKHDDLLEDLVDLTREEGSERAEEAEAVRIDVVDWVDDGELDPVIGRQAIAVLEREAGAG